MTLGGKTGTIAPVLGTALDTTHTRLAQLTCVSSASC